MNYTHHHTLIHPHVRRVNPPLPRSQSAVPHPRLSLSTAVEAKMPTLDGVLWEE